MYDDRSAWNTAVESIMDMSNSHAAKDLLDHLVATQTDSFATGLIKVANSTSAFNFAIVRAHGPFFLEMAYFFGQKLMDRLSASWTSKNAQRQREDLLEGIFRVCDRSNFLAASRLYCNEIIISCLLENDGDGFLRLVRSYSNNILSSDSGGRIFLPGEYLSRLMGKEDGTTDGDVELNARKINVSARNIFLGM